MGDFDEMACSCGTHPTAYTKAAISWLDASAIAQHTNRTAGYDLHSVGLIQPPPSSRWAAVRIGSQTPYLIVEARLRVDQFDVNIPNEGVIVYRVQTSDPLGHAQNNTAPIDLLTTTALTPGTMFTSDTRRRGAGDQRATRRVLHPHRCSFARPMSRAVEDDSEA
jgi:hypothetical protein